MKPSSIDASRQDLERRRYSGQSSSNSYYLYYNNGVIDGGDLDGMTPAMDSWDLSTFDGGAL